MNIKRYYLRIPAKESQYDEYINIYVVDKFAFCSRTKRNNQTKYVDIKSIKDFPSDGSLFWILKNYNMYYIGVKGKESMFTTRKELKSTYYNFKFNDSFENHLQ